MAAQNTDHRIYAFTIHGKCQCSDVTCESGHGLAKSIGYQTPPLEGVPYEHGRSRFANDDGRILPGLYCVGWAKRGPSGTIGTNRPDGYAVADLIAADMFDGGRKMGGAELDRLLKSRNVDVVTFGDWKKIEAAEIARARDDAPREKFTDVKEMLAIRLG